MDIAELRNKLNNIAAELAEHDDVQQEDIAIAEDSYDFTTPGGHKVKDVKHARGRGDSFDDDDYYDPYEDDPYGVELDTPLGPVTAEWDGEYGRGTFGNIQASNKTLSAMRKYNLISDHYSVTIFKNIPVFAGLGGGSSNAATILRNVSKKKISKNLYNKIIKEISSDVRIFFEKQGYLNS